MKRRLISLLTVLTLMLALILPLAPVTAALDADVAEVTGSADAVQTYTGRQIKAPMGNFGLQVFLEATATLDFSGMTATVEFTAYKTNGTEESAATYGQSEKGHGIAVAAFQEAIGMTAQTGKFSGKLVSSSDFNGKYYRVDNISWSAKVPVLYNVSYEDNPLQEYKEGDLLLQYIQSARFGWSDDKSYAIMSFTYGLDGSASYEQGNASVTNMVRQAPVQEVPHYTFGVDSFSFPNSIDSFRYQTPLDPDTEPAFGTYGSALSDSAKNQLLSAIPDYQKAAVLRELQEQNGGLCYGMVAVNGMLYIGKDLKLSQFSTSAKNAYGLQPPKNNKTLQDAIVYYYLSQMTSLSKMQRYVQGDPGISNRNIINILKEKLPQYPVGISLRGDGWCHSILAYYMEERNGGYEVTCYDPNNLSSPLLLTFDAAYQLTFSDSEYDGCTLKGYTPMDTAFQDTAPFQSSLKPMEVSIPPRTLVVFAGSRAKIQAGSKSVQNHGPVNNAGQPRRDLYTAQNVDGPVTIQPGDEYDEIVTTFYFEEGGCTGTFEGFGPDDTITIEEEEIVCTGTGSRQRHVSVARNNNRWVKVSGKGKITIIPDKGDNGYKVISDQPITIVITDPDDPGTKDEVLKDVDAKEGVTIGDDGTQPPAPPEEPDDPAEEFTLKDGLLIEYGGNETDLTLPEDTVGIDAQVFRENRDLVSVTIPGSVKTVGHMAFANCPKLTTVVMLPGVETIADGAFSFCESLRDVTVPSTVREIGSTAFLNFHDNVVLHVSPSSYALYYALQYDIRYVVDQPAPAVPYIFSQGVDPAPSGVALTSKQPVLVGGKAVTLQAYALQNANGDLTNYVKIRDVAAVLDGTAGQFNVDWDGAVNLVTGVRYTTQNGQEHHTPYSGDRAFVRATAPTKVNGYVVDIQAFLIYDDEGKGSTYYKLRDVGQALGFNVGWSYDTGIYIQPGVAYDPAD